MYIAEPWRASASRMSGSESNNSIDSHATNVVPKCEAYSAVCAVCPQGLTLEVKSMQC